MMLKQIHLTCDACQKGKITGEPQESCNNCKIGSYASQNASAACDLCSNLKYGTMEGKPLQILPAKTAQLVVLLKQRDHKVFSVSSR